MALPVVPILVAVVAIAAAASGGSRRRRPTTEIIFEDDELILPGGDDIIPGGDGGFTEWTPPGQVPTKMTRADRTIMLEEIREVVAYLESQFGRMPGLADFLVVLAYRESNFNPNVTGAGSRANAARGLYQMRPGTVFKSRWGTEGLPPDIIYDPIVSTAFAISHIKDAARRSAAEGRAADWFAIRRWWGFPNRIHDHDRTRWPEWSHQRRGHRRLRRRGKAG